MCTAYSEALLQNRSTSGEDNRVRGVCVGAVFRFSWFWDVL